MIRQILKIRIKQAYRNISTVGLFRIAIIVIIFLLFSAFIFRQLQQNPNGLITILLLIVAIFFIHIKRKDKNLLFTIYKKTQLIYLAEYFTFTTPFLIILLIAKRYDLILYQLIGVSLIPFLKTSLSDKKLNLNNKLLEKIPYNCFEIKSGIRSNFYFLISINITGLIFGFWVATAPIIILINTLVFSGFYQICEPRNVIEINKQKPDKFILEKITSNLIIFATIQLPTTILFLLFNYQYFAIVFIVFGISILLIILSILLKYALYSPNANLSGNSIILGIAIVLLPILFLMLPVYYFKAKNNLKHYLDDYY
jgi:hypothetical protein